MRKLEFYNIYYNIIINTYSLPLQKILLSPLKFRLNIFKLKCNHHPNSYFIFLKFKNFQFFQKELSSQFWHMFILKSKLIYLL